MAAPTDMAAQEDMSKDTDNSTTTVPSQPPTTNGNSNNEGATTTVVPGLSSDEMALYDRQIRLWGAQAQERIRSAHILLVSLRALGTEIAKNLTLAGVSSLTIVDDEPVTEEDLGTGFFFRQEDVGKKVTDWTFFSVNWVIANCLTAR